MADTPASPDSPSPSAGGDHLLNQLPVPERASARALGFTGKRGRKAKAFPNDWRQLVYLVFSRGGSLNDLRHAFALHGCSIDLKILRSRARTGELHDLIEKARAQYVGFLRDPLVQIALSTRTDREAVEVRKWLLQRASDEFNANRPTEFHKTVINNDNRVVLPRPMSRAEYNKLFNAAQPAIEAQPEGKT